MANNFMVNINPTFDMGFFSKRLADTYAAKGYNVNVANMGNSCVISFEKGVGGIYTFLGMGEGIKATFTRMDNTLSCAFSDEEWTGKIVACLIGWFLCWVWCSYASPGSLFVPGLTEIS